MRILLIFLALSVFCQFTVDAQVSRLLTNEEMNEVLKGNYEPMDYQASVILSTPDEIVPLIQEQISSDSLHAYLLKLDAFETRNTGSDTISEQVGIGAARRWIKDKFDAFSADNENRLLTGYFQFDMDICGMGRHRNVVAALPGRINNGDVILIEAHMDSRCETACDVSCEARGMEDNGSGTALVMELARVMSQFTFDKTIVFTTTTAEEQGLFGATAMAIYFDGDEPDIDVKAVLNNDVIGGIICGATSSAPSCPGENLIDSTQVRLFSAGGFNSAHKALCRYIKLQYEQELKPYVQVPMLLTLMSAEDRTGRGGDHIPFRSRGMTAMRFTSAHEHGDAGIDEDYHDRQHTSADVLGEDTDGDGKIDSFFVDFHYLARNARINAVAAAMIASSPEPVSMNADWEEDVITVLVEDENNYDRYVLGLRTATNDFDTLYYFEGTSFSFESPDTLDIVKLTIASVNDLDVESCFSAEIFVQKTVGVINFPADLRYPVELWQNAPNPFDEATTISVHVREEINKKHTAQIHIITQDGTTLKKLPIGLQLGVNEILYTHGYGVQGIYNYALVIDGEMIASKSMIFAN